MERNEIIKALNCCKTSNADDCKECTYTGKMTDDCYVGCCNMLIADALALIKELTKEVDDLKVIAEQYQKQFEDAKADTVHKMRDTILRKSTIIDGNDILYGLTYEQICRIAKEVENGG